ncbi:hypothetical protein SpCBS45565_g04158 [Spizellomyces sp. 'palustris']|nr:hypothetical protein SpCBS45565_g04158 [Spizellomyces sp. 'palustris']
MSPTSPPPISNRARANIQKENLLAIGMMKWWRNQYHAEKNPDGIINLGTAENKLMAATLIDLVAKTSAQLMDATFSYGLMYGSQELRDKLADMFNLQFQPIRRVEASEIVVTNGACSAVSNLVQVVCDVGEGILVPAPYYGGFDPDVSNYSLANLITCSCSTPPNFLPTAQDLAQRVETSPIPIRALLLTNPNNPTGRVIPTETLRSYLQFAKSHKLHIILDEIYALSCFRASSQEGLDPFTSILAMPWVQDEGLQEWIHIVWSFSKDFGSSGLRLGCIQSRNPLILKALRPISPFTAPSNATQTLVMGLLDPPTTTQFIHTNQSRLDELYTRLTAFLGEHGVPYIPANAAFFLLVDLRRWTSGMGEQALFERLCDEGVYIACGRAFGFAEEGWFRVVFGVEWEVLEIGMRRLVRVLKEVEMGH